ncbi:hypothetical protein [Leptotrichia shahii]|uniref:hypothetical protein n=1 Tax=Leptotrichia shahii TaxID=157691 RepID=UPI0028D41DDE|nr:hypothetical protein [Leptotrichia shahii]
MRKERTTKTKQTKGKFNIEKSIQKRKGSFSTLKQFQSKKSRFTTFVELKTRFYVAMKMKLKNKNPMLEAIKLSENKEKNFNIGKRLKKFF